MKKNSAQDFAQKLEARRSGEGWIAKCPAHDDRKASLSISEGKDGRVLIHCHAGCALDEILSAAGLTNRDLFPITTHRQGGNSAAPTFDWQKCVGAFTDKHVEQLARWRGFSPEFVRELRERGNIGIFRGLVAFPVHNNGKIVGVHFRLKNGAWNYAPTGIKAAPLVFGELVAGERCNVFESTWDGLAYMDKSGERDGIIITRGAANAKLGVALIPQGCTTYLWTQNDGAGENWQQDFVAGAKCATKRVKILAHDLNDWTRDGATCDDLIGAMVKAQTLREPEIAWSTALSESVITAGELHNLKLTPRKKLLGEWFAESDCGFIFAPRGVGKTFFGIAIASALSNGGDFGDWNAPEAVKVLYVDGEMPAVMMLERIEGLNANMENFLFLNHEVLFDRSGKVLNIANREVQQAITQWCIESAAKVLFLDNLSTLASGMKENEADSWELVNPWLLDLRRRKIAVVIIHHAGRSGEMRGTSKREDNVFWIIALDDMKKNADNKRGARFISHFTKPSRNTQDEVSAYEWHFVTESNGEVTISHKRAQTLDVFKRVIESGVTKCDEVAAAMKLQPYEVSRLAKKAIDAGWLRKSGRAYALTGTA